jgi:hypothetical protein
MKRGKAVSDETTWGAWLRHGCSAPMHTLINARASGKLLHRSSAHSSCVMHYLV